MPLESGSSKATLSHNISTEVKAGKPVDQAAAIAYGKARGDVIDRIADAAMGLAEGARRLTDRLEEMMGARRLDGEFRESDHPRDEDGKFGEGISSDKKISAKNIEPVNPVQDKKKLKSLIASMKKEGWKGRPVLIFQGGDGNEALTGSHRIAAAKAAKIDVPVVEVGNDAVDYTNDNGERLSDFIGKGDDGRLAEFLREAGDERSAELVEAEVAADRAEFRRLYGVDP